MNICECQFVGGDRAIDDKTTAMAVGLFLIVLAVTVVGKGEDN